MSGALIVLLYLERIRNGQSYIPLTRKEKQERKTDRMWNVFYVVVLLVPTALVFLFASYLEGL